MTSFKSHIKTVAVAIAFLGGAGAAMAQDAPADEIELAEPADNAAAGPVLPWYRNFTQSSEAVDVTGQSIRDTAGELEWLTGDRWGLSFGFDSREVNRSSELDGVRAGAFFRLTPRVRVGGELGYIAADDSPVLNSQDGEAPQVKVESAFRF